MIVVEPAEIYTLCLTELHAIGDKVLIICSAEDRPPPTARDGVAAPDPATA